MHHFDVEILAIETGHLRNRVERVGNRNRKIVFAEMRQKANFTLLGGHTLRRHDHPLVAIGRHAAERHPVSAATRAASDWFRSAYTSVTLARACPRTTCVASNPYDPRNLSRPRVPVGDARLHAGPDLRHTRGHNRAWQTPRGRTANLHHHRPTPSPSSHDFRTM